MVGTLAGALVGAVTKTVVAQAFKLEEKKRDLWKEFPDDIHFIKTELHLIAVAYEDHRLGKGNPSVMVTISMEEMRDLAFDIQDFLDRIERYQAEGEASRLHQAYEFLKRVGSHPFASEAKKLIKRLKAAHQRKIDHNIHGGASTGQRDLEDQSAADDLPRRTGPPVGIDKPREELLELLDITGQSEQLSMKVISIVGFSGSGKSMLAKAVYDFPDLEDYFKCRAWVEASKHGDLRSFILMRRQGKTSSISRTKFQNI